MSISGGTSHENWLRTSLCEDLADMQRANGMIPDTRAIERKIDEDIRRWAAENRERKPQIAPRVERKPDEADHAAAKRIAEERNARLNVTKAPDEPEKAACPCGGVCRACKLRQRLLVLIEPLPLAERVPKVEAWRNCKRPKWAREVLDVWAWMTFAKRARRLKREGKLESIVLRKLEDIADRSTAVVGLGDWR